MDSIQQDDSHSFLTECVSDEMSAQQAAESTRACWTEAEEALKPVIGLDGLGVVLRHGEEVAERRLGVEGEPERRASIDAFCSWVRSLSTEQAVRACQAFWMSVEACLESLLGASLLRKLLRPVRSAGRDNFSK